MAEENKVVLHGMWASPYAKRVELALKIKGIPFEYVEEDLQNKSELLSKFNPVYKKVPVLVHNGKPIAESHVIIEYIDENWRNEPKLLPEDPYDRARVRFWAGYFQQVLESSMKLINPDRDVQQKGLEEVHEKLRVLEEGMKDLFPAGFPGNRGQHCLGLLDILLVVSLGAYKIYEQVLEVKMLDPEKNPLIYSWVNSLIELPVVKEVAAPPEKIVSLLQRYRDRLQTSKGIELKV